MNNILFISPAFANGGVIYKYDCRFIKSWSEKNNFIVASRQHDRSLDITQDNVSSFHLCAHTIQSIQGRYFNCLEPIAPDISRITILPFLLHDCKQYIENNKVDIIHTVSFPCSSHLIGYELKKKYKIPWIAHFYDPWVDNPLRNLSKSQKKKDLYFESLVAHNADAIIHSNSIIRDCWIERYGESINNKIFIIPFGYSQKQIDDFKPFSGKLPHGEKVIMSYIGTCAGDRNFQSLIKGVNVFVNENPELRNKLEIRLLGNLLTKDRDLISMYGLDDVIIFIGRVDKNKLEKYFDGSDIFLVIDSPQDKNVFFPSKLVDYFYYQRPIFGISPHIGVTNLYLTESGNVCVDNKDVLGIAEYLKRVLTDFSCVVNFNKEFYQEFTPDVISKTYYDIIKKITMFQKDNENKLQLS